MITLRRTRCMGDVLYAEPVVRALGQYASVYVNTEYPFLFEHHPAVVKSGRPRGANLDRVYENFWARGDFKYVTQCYLEYLNLEMDDLRPQIHLSEEEISEAATVLDGARWVVVDCGYNDIMHFHTEAWNVLFDELKKLGWRIAVIGKTDGRIGNHQKLCVDLDLRGKTNGRQLLAIIHQADCFLGVESGPFVVAMAFDKPGILLSGLTQSNLILLPNSKIKSVSCSDEPIKGMRVLRQSRGERQRIIRSLHLPIEQIICALTK